MPVILTIDPTITMAEALPELRKAKFEITSVLETLHVVTGRADAAVLRALRKLPCVISAEADTTVRLDPKEIPDMGTAWPKVAEREATPRVTGASWRSPAWDEDPA